VRRYRLTSKGREWYWRHTLDPVIEHVAAVILVVWLLAWAVAATK